MPRSVRPSLLRYAVPVLVAGVLSLPALAVTQSPGPGPRGPDPDQVFRTLDLNGDGQIDAGERKAAQLRRFDAMDANKDGRLTVAEIEQAFARPGPPGGMDGEMPPAGGPPPGGGAGMGRPGGPPPGGPGMGGPGMGGPGKGRPDRKEAAARYAAHIGADQPGGVSRADFAARDMPMLSRIDRNGDGKISRAEFDAVAARMKNRPGPAPGTVVQPPPAR